MSGATALERLCELARQKDSGFQRWALADMLRHFDRIPRRDFEIDDEAYSALGAEVARWRTALGRPGPEVRRPGPDR